MTYEKLAGALWVPFFVYIVHRMLIALKYASLTKTEYSRYMGCSIMYVKHQHHHHEHHVVTAVIDVRQEHCG